MSVEVFHPALRLGIIEYMYTYRLTADPEPDFGQVTNKYGEPHLQKSAVLISVHLSRFVVRLDQSAIRISSSAVLRTRLFPVCYRASISGSSTLGWVHYRVTLSQHIRDVEVSTLKSMISTKIDKLRASSVFSHAGMCMCCCCLYADDWAMFGLIQSWKWRVTIATYDAICAISHQVKPLLCNCAFNHVCSLFYLARSSWHGIWGTTIIYTYLKPKQIGEGRDLKCNIFIFVNDGRANLWQHARARLTSGEDVT